MTILFCGGEDIDFILSGAAVSTSAADFRSTHARCALKTSGGAYFTTPALAGLAALWGCFRGNMSAGANSGQVVILRSAGTSYWAARFDATNARWSFEVFDGTSWVSKLAVAGAGTGLRRYDFNLSVGEQGRFRLWQDGALILDFSGDTRAGAGGSVAAVDSVRWSGNSSYVYWSGISEVILADEDTRLFSLATLAPNGAGDANAWSGSYADIDETTLSDADVLYTDTADAEVQIALGNLPTGAYTVKAVALSARAARTADASVASIRLGVKSGGTVDAGTAQALDTAFATCRRLLPLNPVTANLWKTAEVDALQLNLTAA